MGIGSVRAFFSEVFRRHTEDDAEKIVICGAPGTIPDPETLSSACPKPWLYSRVFLFFLLVTALLFAANVLINQGQFGNVLVVGAFGVPFTVLMLFFEFNVFRNISFYTVFKALFIGGGLALIATAVLPSFQLLGNTSVLNAFAAGIGEEVAKLLVVYWILKRNRAYPYILNGLLIGAAVGAGFAAFETAEYGMRNLLAEEDGWMGHSALFVLALRNLLAPGGHVVWAAVSGGALLYAMRREPLSPAVFGRKAFWAAFLLPVALHVFWDLPIDRTRWHAVIRCMGLSLAAWCVVAWFIRRGLEEVGTLRSVPPSGPEEPGKGQIAGVFRRLGARVLDMIIFVFAAFTAVSAVRDYFWLGDWLDWDHWQFAFAVAVLPTALLLEVAVFEVFGTTPGKWAFALRIRDAEGRPISSKTYFRRLLRLWWVGMGCGIPYLCTFLATIQTLRFAGRGWTSYDQALGLDVYEAPIGRLRWMAASALPVGVFVALLLYIFPFDEEEYPPPRVSDTKTPQSYFCEWVAPACGLPYEVREDGTYVFRVELEGGRSQSCIVLPETVVTTEWACLLVVSPAAAYDELDESVRQRRLDENATRTDRIWIRNGDHLALRRLVPLAYFPPDFRKALEELAADADAAEAELSPDDRF